jgi:hypothetical protein
MHHAIPRPTAEIQRAAVFTARTTRHHPTPNNRQLEADRRWRRVGIVSCVPADNAFRSTSGLY